MRTIKITRTRVQKKALAEAERTLLAGEAVAFPTETAYGLAADPRNPKAVREVFRIKGRSSAKALPFIAANVAAVAKQFILKGGAADMGRKHWPGPLTLVLPFKRGSVLAKVSGQTTGAVRVPASAWARALADAVGGIVTSTSANMSGDGTYYSAAKVIASFRGRRALALVLDAGTLPQRLPSTIVAFKKGKAVVLRQGTVKI
jgi:L-threonylcarbamoyladenylate synthase